MFKFLKPKPKVPKGLHPQYHELLNSDMPRVIREAMKEYGTWEYAGRENNPKIIGWAREIGGWIGGWYKEDSIPWCGLFVGVVCQRAGFPFNQTMLAALKWVNFGTVIPKSQAARGDIMIFKRTGGGHVGFYVGEDYECYHILGGNQKDGVNIMRIKKDRLHAVRRCPWKYRQPKTVQVVYKSVNTAISTQEA